MFNTVPNTSGNPIFSSYSVRDAKYTDNMDDYVKAPNDIYIEEQQNKKNTTTKNINQQALKDVPDMPEFLKEEYEEVYKTPEWFRKLNVVSPSEIEEWKNKGGMGIAEAWERNNKWKSFAPYVNTTKDAADAITVSVLLNRAKKGEELTYEQQEKLVDYLRDMKELEVRGFTFGGGTVNAILSTIPYLEEFGIGLAASAEAVGFASLAKTLSTIGAKKAARKAVEAELKKAAIKSAAPAAVKTTVPLSTAKKIYKDTLINTTGAKALANVGVKEGLKETAKALPSAVASSAKFGLTKMPHTFMGGIADRQIATGIYVTDLGDAVFTSSEHPALSIMKSLGDSTFEALTETAGWTFSPVANYFAKPVQKVLPKKFFTEFDKLVSSRYGMAASNALKKYGYDGVIEEMGEEVLNRFLCQVFGLNGLDEYNFDGFMNNVLYADNPSQWGQEALSFAAVGGAGHIVAGTGSKVSDEWKKKQYEKDVAKLTDRANRYIQSPEQFYLDQGLIKINGSQSLAEQRLRDIWSSQNVDKSLQDDILKNMSENEIRTELKKTIEENKDNETPETAAKRIENDLTKKFMDNKTFAKEKDAKTVAALFAAPLQKLSETTGISLDEIMQEEMPEIQREAEAAAKENGRYIQTDGRIEELFDTLNNLPDDFSDENYIAQVMDEIDILSKIRDGILEQEDYDKVKTFISALEYAEHTELAKELKELVYNQTGQLFQSFDIDKNLKENFDMSADNLVEMIKADIENILQEADVTPEEFNMEDLRVYGSYTTGKNKETSDLDFILQYSGSMREDDAFNMLHYDNLTIEDKNGRTVNIDINPINRELSGTIDEHLGKSYFQSVETAGAKGSAEISAAKKEWEEKGVESSYFKKWFGDSKVVDEDGKPLVVYHGTRDVFDTFDVNKKGKASDTARVGFWFSDRENFAENFARDIWWGEQEKPVVMPVYISMQNPKIYEKKSISKEELNAARDKVDEIENKIKELNQQFNKIVQETGSFYKATEAVEKPRELLKAELKEAKNVYAELRYSDPYEQLRTDIRKMEGGNAEDANFGGLGMVLKDPESVERFVDKLKKEGYDGIIIKGTHFDSEAAEADNNNQYAVFYPEQIKSVNNRGTFDAENPNIYYQTQSVDLNNLIMAHATKADRIDDIIEAGELVAPSMSITKKGSSELSNRRFGDVLFVRNPRKIDFQNDNIYDRDIYSPRLPAPDYEMPNGVIVDSYQRSSMQREWQYNQEKFINRYGKTFDEYFKDAKKVLFLGYTPSGNRRYRPYKPNFLLEYLKSNKLVNGENVQYGFSNFLAKFSKQQLSKYQLKDSAEKGLSDREENEQEYEKLREVYGNLPQITGFRQMAKEEYQDFWTFEEVLDDILYAVATNNSKKLYKYIDKNKFTKEVRQELKSFTDKALALPRSYFEAKPLRKVDLYEFPYALTQKGTLSDAQKKGLKDWGVTVIEYEDGNINEALKQVESKQPEIYFQSAYHGTPHKFDEFSTENIGTGEGAQAHGWGLYFAENKDVSEGYREKLSVDKTTYDGKPIPYIADIKNDMLINAVLNTGEERALEILRSRKQNDTTKKQIEYIENLDVTKLKREKGGQLFEVDIPDNSELIDEQKSYLEQSEKVQKGIKKLVEDNGFEDLIYTETKEDFLKKVETVAGKQGVKIAKEIIKAEISNVQEDIYKAWDKWNELEEKLNIDVKNFDINSIYRMLSAVNYTGRNLYNDLAKITGSPKKASELLNRYGIKGITYDGHSDGRCYVVFDDKAVKVLEKYYQKMEDDAIQTNMLYDNVTPRKLRNMNIKGAFVPAENLIELFKNADESTIIHEFAHWWLTRLEKYAKNNEELALDLAEVRKFLKNNGEKFTTEQHEKFAVGFEAYIRNGSARSNRLKRIFEDFKNALIQIYDSIKQLVYTEDGTQYSFSEDDVAHLEKLFERLLTTENERIRKTVFDRCDDINEKIKEIKSRQEEEMKELDEIWKDNIAANNRVSDKKRKVEEYLEMAETAVARVPKEVREMKQRYKDVTLSILEVATGYKRQFIANPRNWEKVQEKFEATDNITASDGFHPEWAEFYNDTGVSYDNQEIDGDYKLAEQAFEVLTDGTYNFNNIDEDEIGDFYGKFEYLYNKVQSLKGEEKATALEALYSLFDNMPSMPDEVVADLVEKLGKVEDDYNEGQKEDFNRKRYPNIPVVQQLQFYVTNKLSELRIYDPNVRYKVRISKSHSLYKAIKHATSVNATKRIVRKINEYVISDLENQAKNILHKEIQKQIRVNSKLVKVGTLSKGKFDWKTNTVFAELAEINKLKPKEAFKEYGAIIELDKAAAGEERENNDENPLSVPELKTDFQSNLKRKFLEYRSSKVNDLNLAATRSLLEDIMTLKFEGRRAKDAEELEKQLQRDNMKTDLAMRVRSIKGNNAAKNIAKFIMGETGLTSEKTLVNWETALNALFGKEVAQRYSLLKLESDAEVYAYKHYADFCQKAMDIYGLNNPISAKEKFIDKFNRFVDFGNIQPFVKLMQEYEEEVYNFKEVTYSKETGQFIETGVLLSRAEIITLYAWSMNEELEQRLFTQYGLHQVEYMFNEVLSDEDKQLAWLLIDTCESMYDENNEVFIRTMGLSLPKVQNYFPSKTVRVGSEIDMLHENVVRSSNPSFIKQRKTCKRIKMKPEQPLSILVPHINKTARYVILSERLNYLNAIFKDATVRAAIKEVFDGVNMPLSNVGEKLKGKRGKQKRTVGDRIHDTLLNQLGASTFENYVRGLNVGKSWADALATNYITSRIGGNFKVMFGQLTSVINYAEKMPLGLWSKGFTENLKKPKETFKFMMENCDYLKARLAGNSMNEIMTKITDESDRFRTLRNFCSTNTKYGDILAICFGGKPYIDYLMKQGMSKEEAFDKFVEDTLRAQQSGHNSATSIWQKKMSENFFTRMMFAFNNTSLQYERKFLDALASRARGDISQKDMIKAILIYKVFNPIIFTSFLGNLSLMQLIGSLMRGDDDDTLARFGIDVGSAVVFSNMGAYGFAGMGITTALRFLMTLIDKDEYKPFLKAVPIISDIEEIGKELILKNEVTFADWVDAMALITDDATGVPATRLTNAAGGIGDVVKGNILTGLLRLFGYGKYRANVAATGKPPEKKK